MKPSFRLLAIFVAAQHKRQLQGEAQNMRSLWFALGHLPCSTDFELFGRHVALVAKPGPVVAFWVTFVLGLPAVLLVECLWVGWERSSIRTLLVSRTASGRTSMEVGRPVPGLTVPASEPYTALIDALAAFPPVVTGSYVCPPLPEAKL